MKSRKPRTRPWLRRTAAGVVAVLLAVWLGPSIAACVAAAAEPAHCQRCPREHGAADGAHGQHRPPVDPDAPCQGCGTDLSVRHCGLESGEALPARGGGSTVLPPPALAWQMPASAAACATALASGVDDYPSIHPTLRFCVFLN